MAVNRHALLSLLAQSVDVNALKGGKKSKLFGWLEDYFKKIV